jgi:peptide/nickel transport system substrate-binding protein
VNRLARPRLTILIASLSIAVSASCSRQADSQKPAGSNAPSRGGSIVATTRTDPPTFNRIAQSVIATDIFAFLTQGRLVRINRETGDVEPWLAEKWQTAVDGKTYTLTLRDGVTWSDGTPFTSADVLFTFAAIYDPKTASPLASSVTIEGKPLTVSAPDARTVVVTYPQVFGPGISLLDNVTIVPKHKLSDALAAGAFAKAWSASTPPNELVSIGPFLLTDYRPGERLIFERNPKYWRRDAQGVQLPYADKLTLELVPQQDAEMVRLQSGQSDFNQQSLRATDIETLRALAEQHRAQVVDLGIGTDADSFVFNLRPDKWKTDPRASWIGRKEFRQAVSHAVDRQVFADTVFLGAAVPLQGPVTPGNKRWFWPDVPTYSFSREKALALLATIGLKNRDQDEWLEDEQGHDARITVLTFRGNGVLERSAEFVTDALRKIGIAADVQALEPNAVRQRVVGGDFEAAYIQFAATDPDPALSRDFWSSDGSAHFWNPNQKTPGTEWERQIDELMVKQAGTNDELERRRLFNEVQRLFAENLPIVYFAAPRVYIGASARLMNLHASQNRPPLMWSADTLAVRNGKTP